MAQFPALPIWTDALLGDTTHLTQAEFGAYLLMLIVAWRSPGCCLPNDEKYLARITRSHLARNWRVIRSAVMPFWRLGEDGQLRQKRLSQVHLVSAELRLKASAAGKSSSLKRKERLSTTVEALLAASTNQTSTLPSPSPKERKERSPTVNGDAVRADEPKAILFGPCLDWLSKQNGKGPDEYRSIIGKWIKDYGEKNTLKAITKARDYPPLGDTVAYISRLLNPPKQKQPQI